MAKEKAKEREKRSKREERKVKRKQSRVSVLETHLKTARAQVRRRPPCTCTYDEGAAAYLENGVGTTFPLVVDEVVSKQLFKAHTAELLPADDYKLVVKSRAGDAAGPLQTSFRRVKYLRVVDPEPVPLAQTSDGQVKVRSATEDGVTPEVFTYGKTWKLSGEGFTDSEAGWEVSGAWLCDPGEYEMACTVNGDSEITLSHYEVNRPGVGMHADATLKVKAMRGGDEGMIEEDLVFPFPFKVLPDEP